MKKYVITFKTQGSRGTANICVAIQPHRILTDEQQASVGLHFYVGRLVRIVRMTQI